MFAGSRGTGTRGIAVITIRPLNDGPQTLESAFAARKYWPEDDPYTMMLTDSGTEFKLRHPIEPRSNTNASRPSSCIEDLQLPFVFRVDENGRVPWILQGEGARDPTPEIVGCVRGTSEFERRSHIVHQLGWYWGMKDDVTGKVYCEPYYIPLADRQIEGRESEC